MTRSAELTAEARRCLVAFVKLNDLPFAFVTTHRLGVRPVRTGLLPQLYSFRGLNSTPTLLFHAATITLGYPHASALHFRMG